MGRKRQDELMRRVVKSSDNEIVLDEGEGYYLRAISAKIGAVAIVVVDWQHPNYGYFSDAFVAIKSLHMQDWQLIPIVDWSLEFKSADDFLREHPEFKRLFATTVTLGDLLKRGLKEVT